VFVSVMSAQRSAFQGLSFERIYEMSTSGSGSFVGAEPAMGRSSFVDDPTERDGTSPPAKKAPRTIPPSWTKKIDPSRRSRP
jgi:hypothetical protein